MLGIFLFFLCFLIVTITIYRRKGITSSFFIYFLYTLSGLSSIILIFFYNSGKNPFINDYNSGAIYLLFALLLFLYPFAVVRDDEIKSITILKDSILKPITYISTFLSFFSIVYFIPVVKNMIFIDIADIARVRNTVAAGENPFITESLFNTIAGTAASFYVLQLLFFFLSLVDKRRITKFALLMLLSSLSYPLFVLAYLGRDGVLFWFISFVSYYLLFHKYLPHSIKKRLTKISFIIFIPFVVVFLFITVGRFIMGGAGSSDGILFPLLSYLGQGPINFAELYYTDVRAMGYGTNVFGLLFPSSDNNSMFLIEGYDLVSWVFKTFVSSIYLDFGSVLTLVIAIILILLFYFFYQKDKSKQRFSFSFLIMYSLFFTIYSQGLFYFRQYNRVGNLFILVMILFAFVSTLLSKRVVFLNKD